MWTYKGPQQIILTHTYHTFAVPLHTYWTYEIPLHTYHTCAVPLHTYHTCAVPLHTYCTYAILHMNTPPVQYLYRFSTPLYT